MTATLVQLINGQFVQSDAVEWLHECLARHVLSLPTLSARREWLASYEKRHGADDTEALKYAILQQRKART